jgi:hypothetical protein
VHVSIVYCFYLFCGICRWQAMEMLPIRSVNRMPITQVNLVRDFYQFITIADSIVISFDTMAVHTFSCQRPALYYRICKYHNRSAVPLHCQFASRWECPCVSLVVWLSYSTLICLHKWHYWQCRKQPQCRCFHQKIRDSI